MSRSFVDLLEVHRGHFRLESGMHGDIWFDLERAYVRPKDLEPFVDELVRALVTYTPDAICGALVGGAFIGYSAAQKMGVDFMYTERFELDTQGGGKKVEYRLPREFRSIAPGRKVAVVDDVINAGSAVLKTSAQLAAHGAQPVVLASLLTVGGTAPKRLPGTTLPIVTLGHLVSSLWQPHDCPLCSAGAPLTDPYADSAT